MSLGIIALIFLAGLIGSVALINLLFNANSAEKIASKYEGSDAQKSTLVKKYYEADLRRYGKLFLGFGLIFGLALSLVGFTYKDVQKVESLEALAIPDDFELEPPPTQQIKQPPPPPPPPEIEIVEDEEILEEEPQIEEVDVDIEEVVEAPPEIPEEETIVEDEIFTIVEENPRFPGCENEATKEAKKECADLKLLTYLQSIQYPPMAKENDIEGKVFVQFIVEKDGSITNVTVPMGADQILNDAAIKHVKNMPKWIPGKQRGQSVRVQFAVPINFKLQ